MRSLATTLPTPVPLFDVIATYELARRSLRAPDFEAERRAANTLAQTLLTSPRSFLPKLADVALDLCRAHSAGISLLEGNAGKPVLRWRALSGKLAPYLGRTLPRAFSPCSSVLDRDALQLMSRPARHFRHIEGLSPGIEEALSIPFHVNRRPLGTLWVVAHDQARRFDAEDARLITGLAEFAAAALKVLTSLRQFRANVTERGKVADLAVVSPARAERPTGSDAEPCPVSQARNG